MLIFLNMTENHIEVSTLKICLEQTSHLDVIKRKKNTNKIKLTIGCNAW